MSQNNYIKRNQILNLANSITESNTEDLNNIDIAGVYVGGDLGFPLRMFTEESDQNPGEPKNFSDAYDKACKVLGSEKVSSYAEYGFVWFTDKK